MALTPPLVLASLNSNRATGSSAFDGPAFSNLATGIATGVCAWAVGQPQNVALSGGAVGTLGVGAIVSPLSRLVIPPNVSVMRAAFLGAGLVGPLGDSLATAITLGLTEAFNLYGNYAGLSSLVAVGQDTSKITLANPVSLIGILNMSLPGAGVAGLAAGQMAVGLGNGISGLLLLGGGTAPVAGAPVLPIVPGVGPTTSVVV